MAGVAFCEKIRAAGWVSSDALVVAPAPGVWAMHPIARLANDETLGSGSARRGSGDDAQGSAGKLDRAFVFDFGVARLMQPF
jgi:hypothetical protein